MLKLYYFRGELPQADVLRARTGGNNTVRRPESLVWRLLLRAALEDAGMDADLSRLALSPTGRPYLPGAAFDFSPTHTAGFVAVVLSNGGTVGLDAEALRGRDISRLVRAADRWFTPGECARVRAALGEDPAAAEETFLRVWTAKEALVKRTGAGLAGMRDVDSDAPQGCTLRTLLLGGIVLTVAAPHAGDVPELRQLVF